MKTAVDKGIEPDYLDAVDLEKDLDEKDLVWLCTQGAHTSFPRQAQVYRQGESAPTVFILQSGVVKATCTDRSGREALLKIHGPGSFLGLSALRPNPVRDATGVALERCEMTVFPREEFLELMRSEGRLGILLVQLLLKRQQELHARVSEMAGHRVDQRLARVLLQLSAEAGARGTGASHAMIPITHEELATLVLSRRQYVTAILRQFVADGLIRNRRGQIAIIDPCGLSKVVRG